MTRFKSYKYPLKHPGKGFTFSILFFLVKPGYPRRWPKLISWPGWQGLPKRPSADEEEGRTPNLVSEESMPTAPPGPLGYIFYSLSIYNLILKAFIIKIRTNTFVLEI
jgi:hypothetical protein